MHGPINRENSINRFSITQKQIETSPIRTIAIVVYPGIEIFDAIGPMDVFKWANSGMRREGLNDDAVYQLKLVGVDENPVTTLLGVQLGPVDCYKSVDSSLDTLIIPGGDVFTIASEYPELINWVRSRSKEVRRVASVCTGAFIMAEAGLFEGRRATTHWDFSDRLKHRYPSIDIEPDRIFIKDGPIWSSGGITSGIDLALAMVEEDWGHKLALHVARYLVVFLKRQGGQSQYSEYLKTDTANRHDVRELQAWIIENIQQDLSVEVLAEHIAMSPRNFARVFRTETGVTPAKYIEIVRVDLARHYLESTRLNISVVAQKAGFKDSETLRKTFARHVGVNPVDYRARFGDVRVNGKQLQSDDPNRTGQAKRCPDPVILEKLKTSIAV